MRPDLRVLPLILRRARGLLGAGLLTFVTLTLAACDRQAQPAFERPPAPVTVATAITRDTPLYLDEVGKCAANEVVSVQPQISGRIV
jgi:multidrug efflux pump subunit AcrA (membrane-fusion protein)